MPTKIKLEQGRKIWIQSQKLDLQEPFGKGPEAALAAIEHLGYVQIDTINVIERCHHHIFFNRIPRYRRQDLHQLQTKERSIFEYWTHALSYIPTRDFKFYIGDMNRRKKDPGPWLARVTKDELQKVLREIKKNGALSIRDFQDENLVEKDHEWSSRKPSKKALQWGFYGGRLTINERLGMLKKYELVERHFGWTQRPKAATKLQVIEYLLDRALRSQGLVSLDSVCHLYPSRKKDVLRVIESRVKKNILTELILEGHEKIPHWIQTDTFESFKVTTEKTPVHILSPFDPLIIQRKRLKMFFGYEHLFEAYIPKEKRVFGYFTLPVLMDDKIVAVLDLKTDRVQNRLIVQKWSWLKGQKSAERKKKIEDELDRFEKFQLGTEL